MDLTGQELLDASGRPLGIIVGPGYERRKFGTAWLLVSTVSGLRVLVPADCIDASGERPVLPYPRGYVENGPVLEGDGPLDADGERRLRLHWGIGGGNGGQCQGCGLCIGTRRAQRRREAG